MSESMVQFQISRREDLRRWPASAATATKTNGVGSRGNTGHLNLTKPMGRLK